MEAAALPEQALPPLPPAKPEPPVSQQTGQQTGQQTARLTPAGAPSEGTAPEAQNAPGETLSPADASSSPGATPGGGGATRGAAPSAGNAPPDYPMSARRRGHEGLVLLEVSLTPAGRPERIELAESSGWRSLDRAALEAVERWRFEPAMENGAPVAAVLRLPVRFRLED